MKIAIIGSGKTGSELIKQLPKDQISAIYNTSNPPTPEKLKQADAAIIFVPGSSVEKLLPIILESRIPAIWGSTGFTWPDHLDALLKKQQTKWIVASNFSLGMNLIRHCLKKLADGKNFLPSPHYHIHEIHHIHKKDKPSGTALTWKNWLGIDCDITSERKDDINGIHELTLKTDFETITLKHEAHSRALFAQGALWATDYLLNHPVLENGLYPFEEIVEKELL